MLKLEDLKSGQSVMGLEPTVVVTLVAVVPIAEGAVRIIYNTPAGDLKDRLLSRNDEASISLATTERPWSFDGDGAAFQLTCEAKRIDLAFLFDPMMAIHTSNVQALPHQITAVYESMLPRQPLRFVLADDPGAGKTIMAGLYMRELIMRAERASHPDCRSRESSRTMAGRTVRKIRPGISHLLLPLGAGIAKR